MDLRRHDSVYNKACFDTGRFADHLDVQRDGNFHSVIIAMCLRNPAGSLVCLPICWYRLQTEGTDGVIAQKIII